jgi:hypothetical protein
MMSRYRDNEWQHHSRLFTDMLPDVLILYSSRPSFSQVGAVRVKPQQRNSTSRIKILVIILIISDRH